MDNIRFKELCEQLDTDYNYMSEIIDKNVDEVCGTLDKEIANINIDNISYDKETEALIIRLAQNLYFAITSQESYALKEGIAKQLKLEMQSKVKLDTDGTVAHKESVAQLETQEEELITLLYNRTYKTIKLKVEAGYEILNSLKKVLSTHIAEMELSNSRYVGGSIDE